MHPSRLRVSVGHDFEDIKHTFAVITMSILLNETNENLLFCFHFLLVKAWTKAAG